MRTKLTVASPSVSQVLLLRYCTVHCVSGLCSANTESIDIPPFTCDDSKAHIVALVEVSYLA